MSNGARDSGLARRHAALPIAKHRYIGRWTMAVLTLALISWFVMRLAVNPVLDWAVVGEYLFSPQILSGVRNTIVVTLLAEIIGIVAGLFLAIARISPNPVIQTLSWFYIWFFRGIPVLVQLIFWFNLGLVFQTLSLSIPFTDVVLLSADTNQLITPFIAVLLGLGLNEAAYDAEIIRGGILSVSRGQTEAAASLGMSSTKTMRFVILPQALRVIIPPISNQLIIMLKISSLASVVTYRELTTTAQNIYSVNLRTIELLLVASIWYIALTTVCTLGQDLLERRLGRSLATPPKSRLSGTFIGRRKAGRI